MSMIGLRVGPFEIIEPAAVPEPGDWYRARRTGMTRRQPAEVLVKLLSPDAEGPERARLQSEYDNLRAMEDARVPAAISLFEGIGALAIDAPDGVSFDDIIAARAKGTVDMSPPTLLDLALEVAETLQHAHHRNRYHGHLSPHVLRLSTAGSIVIFGFGTGSGGVPHPDWHAPEHARDEPSTPLTDQWALAAVLAGLISGRTPWEPSEDGSRMDPRTGDPESIVAPIERQWPALSRLFRRMLDPDPANRHPSMQPVRQELLALARKAGGTSARRELGKKMARRVQRAVRTEQSAPRQPADSIPEHIQEHDTGPTVPGQVPSDPTETQATVHDADARASDPQAVTEAVTEAALAPSPAETAEEMDAPPPPDPTPATDQSSGPTVAKRVIDADESPAEPPASLPDEPIRAVHPDLGGTDDEAPDVPHARREGDWHSELPPGPAASLRPTVVPEDVDDPDSEDAPTVQAAEGSGFRVTPPADATFDADEESSDVGLAPPSLAEALAHADEPGDDLPGQPPEEPRPVGEGPTAVPFTDPGTDPGTDLSDDAPPEPPSSTPSSAAPPAPAPPPRLPEPVVPLEEPKEAVREELFEPPERSAIQRWAPALAAVMVLLMIVAIAISLM